MRTKVQIVTLVLALLLAATGLALTDDGAALPRSVLGAGTSDSSGDSVTLRATLGQPLVGGIADGGGQVALGQGFWHGIWAAGTYEVYLPIAVRD